MSAAAFGTSGTLATSLLRAGWSPAAVVLARITVAAVALAGPVLWSALAAGRSGRPLPWRRRAGGVVLYGLVAVAGCQLCYFEAVARMSAAPALLLEYSGTLLVVAWMWARHRQHHGSLTAAGACSAVVGLVLVIGVGGHLQVNVAGVVWGLAAAVGLAAFFVLSAGAPPDVGSGDDLPPMLVAWGGLAVGAAGLALAGVIGVVPLHASASATVLAGHRVSWIVPVLGLALVAAALAYVTGVAAARALGARVSSFAGLTEVLFSAAYAWLALGERLTAVQLVGGGAVLVGIGLVKLAERPVGEPPEAQGGSGALPGVEQLVVDPQKPASRSTRST